LGGLGQVAYSCASDRLAALTFEGEYVARGHRRITFPADKPRGTLALWARRRGT